MKIFFAGDHAGFELKQKLIEFVRLLGHEVEDLGPFSYDANDDYPDYVVPVAKAVGNDPERNRGVIIGGSGQGEAMCANRVRGVRSAVYYGPSTPLGTSGLEIVKKTREHNDANILSLGARFMSEEEARAAVKLWLETPFSNEERHIRRLAKIDLLAA